MNPNNTEIILKIKYLVYFIFSFKLTICIWIEKLPKFIIDNTINPFKKIEIFNLLTKYIPDENSVIPVIRAIYNLFFRILLIRLISIEKNNMLEKMLHNVVT